MRRICGMDWDCYSRATRCSWAGTPMKAVQGFGHRAAIHGPSGSTQNAKVRILVEVERRGMEQLHCGSRRSGLEVNKLKEREGRDLLIFEHGMFGQTLLKEQLLDRIDLS